MGEYYDRKGRPIDRLTWLKLVGDTGYRIVRQDETPLARLSTIWLGVNYGEPWPVLFETMAFLKPEGLGEDPQGHHADLYDMRWRTEKEAIEGHEDALFAVRQLERRI